MAIFALRARFLWCGLHSLAALSETVVLYEELGLELVAMAPPSPLVLGLAIDSVDIMSSTKCLLTWWHGMGCLMKCLLSMANQDMVRRYYLGLCWCYRVFDEICSDVMWDEDMAAKHDMYDGLLLHLVLDEAYTDNEYLVLGMGAIDHGFELNVVDVVIIQ